MGIEGSNPVPFSWESNTLVDALKCQPHHIVLMMQFGQYTQIIPLQLLHKAITVTYSLDQQNNNINLQKFAFPSPSPKATTHIRIQETKWVSDNDGFKQKQFINKYYSHTIIKSDAQLFILTSLLNATGLYISMDN